MNGTYLTLKKPKHDPDYFKNKQFFTKIIINDFYFSCPFYKKKYIDATVNTIFCQLHKYMHIKLI